MKIFSLSKDYIFTLICETYRFLKYAITIKEQCE